MTQVYRSPDDGRTTASSLRGHPEQIRRQLRIARDILPQDDLEAARTRHRALSEAKNNPVAAAESIDIVVDILNKELRTDPGRAYQTFQDETTDREIIVAQALDAFSAVAEHAPSSISTDSVVRGLVRARKAAGGDQSRRILDLLGRYAAGASETTLTDHVFPDLRRCLSSTHSDVGGQALVAAGRLISNNSPTTDPLIDLIEDAYQSEKPLLQGAALASMGMALLESDPPVETARTLFVDGRTRSEEVRRGVAVAACQALAGSEKTVTLAHEIINWFHAHEDPQIRADLPAAIAITAGEERPDALGYKHSILSEFITDDSEVVRVATVDAVAEILKERSPVRITVETEDGPEQRDITDCFQYLLDTAILEFEGATRQEAITAYRDLSSASMSVGTDLEMAKGIARTAIKSTDPTIRESAQEALSLLEASEAETDDSPENQKSPAQGGQVTDHSAIQDRGRQVADDLPDGVRPIIDAYEQTDAPEDRAVIVAAAGHRLAAENALTPTALKIWAFLDDPWQEGTPQVQVQVITAAEQAVANGPLDWEAVASFFDRARTAETPVVREATLTAIGTLLQEGHVKSSTIDGWIDEGFSDDRPTVRRAAIEIISRGVVGSHFTWKAIQERLEAALVDESEVVAREAIHAVASGLQDGELTWTETGDLLFRALADDRIPVAERAVQAVHDLILNGISDWERTIEFLDRALSDARVTVASEGFRAIRAGFQEGTIAWSAASEFIYRGLADDREVVAREAVEAVGVGLQEKTLTWDETDQFLKRALTDNREAVVRAAVGGFRAGLHPGSLTWEETSELLYEALADDRVTVARKAVEAVGVGLQREQVTWTATNDFLDRALADTREEVAREAVRAVAAGLREGDLTWAATNEFLNRALADERVLIAKAAVQTVHDDVVDDNIEWCKIRPFLNQALNDDRDKIAVETIETVWSGLQEEALTWSTGGEFLDKTATDDRVVIAERAVKALHDLALEGSVEWDETKPALKRALDDDREIVAREAVATVTGGLQTGTFTWEETSEFLDQALADDREKIARGGVDAVVVGLREGDLTWKTASDFFNRALADDRIPVAKRAVQGVHDLVASDSVGWTSTGVFLARVLNDDREEIAPEAVRAVGAGLQEGTLTWNATDEFLYRALTDNREPVAQEAIGAVGAGLRENTITWDAVREFVHQAVTDDRPAVAREAVVSIGEGLVGSELTWTQAAPLFRYALDHHPKLSDAVTNAILHARIRQSIDFQPVQSDDEYSVFYHLFVNATPFDRFRLFRVVLSQFAESGTRLDVVREVTTVGIKAPNPGIRQLTVQLLSVAIQAGNGKSIPVTDRLEALWDDGDSGIRNEIIHVAGRALVSDVGDQPRLKMLLTAGFNDSAPTVRAAAIVALTDACVDGSLPTDAEIGNLFETALNDADPDVRERAIIDAGRLLSDAIGNADKGVAQTLTAALFDRLADRGELGGVRRQVATTIASAALDLSSEVVEVDNGIGDALSTFELDQTTRLQLVESLITVNRTAITRA